MSQSREEIFEKVKAVLVDALGVDDDEVTHDAVVRDDLGAESIDFLDIQFRLEKTFNIKITKGEMMPEGLANDPTLVQGDKLTPAGIEKLRQAMPFADLSEYLKNPQLEAMSKLFTVDFLVNFVLWKLKGA